MKILFQTNPASLPLALVLMTFQPSVAQAAAFTPGNIVVYRAGDGSAGLGTAATAAFLVEYNTSGALVQTIALPTTVASSGNRAMTCAGSQSLEGQLALSPNGKYLTCVGYNAAPGTASVASTANTTSSDVARVIGRLDASGNIDSSTALVGAYPAVSIRGAVFTSASTFYTCGANATPNSSGGVLYVSGLGASSGSSVNTSTIRAVSQFGSDLYHMSSSGVSKYTGLPTSSATPTSANMSLTGGTSFTLANVGGTTVCYVTDTTTLRKYSVSGGVFTARGTATTTSAYGVAAKVSGTTVILYLSSGSKIETLIDSSGATGNLSGTATQLGTAAPPNNTAFRGITLVPAEFSVAYNANSATSGTAPTDSTVYGQFESATAAANSGSLARAGYTFAGWNTAANGSGTTYAVGANIPGTTGTLTLYAKWTATVTYDANGGINPPTDNTAYAQYQSATVASVGSMTRTGYSFTGWNTAANGSGTSYAVGASVPMSGGDVTLHAQWTLDALPTYAITPSAGAGGTISPSSVTNVTQNTDMTFTITPNTGYIINQVLVDGVNNPAAVSSGSYTFVNVTATHTISATFIQVFPITASAGAGGSISPSGTTNVISGSNMTFTITANSGYVIDQVLVDGVNNPAAAGSGSYIFTNVTTSHTIAASFLPTYSITASAGAGGSIFPSGTTTVTNGNNQAYTITADGGYSICNVVVDGVAIGATNSYTFASVTTNHTISALFVAPAASPTAGTISVNYYLPSSSSQAMAPTNSVGAIPATNWNNISFAGLGSFAAPIQVFHDNSGLPVGPFNALLSNNGNNTFNSTSTNRNVDMLSTWAMNGGGTVTFTNIPYTNGYSLYVYFTGFLGGVGSNVVRYTIGTVTNTLWQTNTPSDVVTYGYIQNNNYVVFSNLTGNVQTMIVTYVAGNNSSGIAGFQIKAKTSAFIGASSTKNPSGYKDAVAFTATLPIDATGSVVFSSTNESFSTNAVSGGNATSLSITNLPRGTNWISVSYGGDLNYLGFTTNIEQFVTNHPPEAHVMTVMRPAGLALMIALSDLATNWTDNPDGDQVSLTSVTMQSTNGVNLLPLNWSTNLDGSIVATNPYAFIGYTNSPNVNDQISYSISDGFGGMNTGYVNIVIQSSVIGTNSITDQDFTSPYSNTITAYGIPNFYYVLERATNLTSPVWVGVQTNQAATNGVINAVDTFWDLGGVKPSPTAFYQLKWQP